MANTNNRNIELEFPENVCEEWFNYMNQESEKGFDEGLKRLDCIKQREIKEVLKKEKQKELLRIMANRKPY